MDDPVRALTHWRKHRAIELRHETVREVDTSELDRLRADVAYAMELLAQEVSRINGTVVAIHQAVDAELRRRA